jgi:hypothetical protein
MPRPCSVCTSERRHAIDAALVNGVPVDELARRYAPLSATAIRRHRDAHIPKAVAQAHAQEDVAHGLDVLAQLRAINGVTMSILAEARRNGRPDLALRAVDRVLKQLELQSKLLGELQDDTAVSILIASPEWVATRGALIAALRPYPAARTAVLGELLKLEAGQ